MYRRVFSILDKLPHNADISRSYCNRYSGILVVDGKFVKKRIKNVLRDNDYLTEQQLLILKEIYDRKSVLFGYLVFKNTKQGSKFPIKYLPRTTNIIESYNSHLQGRLSSIRGFENFKTANNWLNAYFLRRRIKTLYRLLT